LNGYFDGAGAAGGLSAFDWRRLEAQPLIVADPSMQNYAIDREKGTVRVLVAANRNVDRDRFLAPTSAADSRQTLKEAGLHAKLFSRHGARVVRAVDNLITVDVPLPQAAKLGLALEKEGIASRPARLFRASLAMGAGAVAAAAHALPSMAPTMQFLPFPAAGFEATAAGRIGALNADSGRMLGFDGLWKSQMTGKGSVVGIIDSGLDRNHPDFKDRVLEYVDLTGEGDKDMFGHGTHVAGTLGGSGRASQGKFKGAAPETKFVIFKVFDKDGNTTEDTIIAAMKKAASLPPEKRPQVINMSLGGPGDPQTDPLSRMANRLMLKDNILVVAAAGNSGPSNGTVGAPGNAQYILTVTGVNKSGEFPFFTSRGSVTEKDGDTYSKPDLSTVAGDVNLEGTSKADRIVPMSLPAYGRKGEKGIETCVYAPGGVISDRSSDDPDAVCIVPGHPQYRYMSGTSMATPMAAGAAADVIGYLRLNGVDYTAVEIKALLMETARDLKKPSETQGAGLLDGNRLASAVLERVKAGVPIGNIAYMLSVRLTSEQRQAMAQQTRFRMTPLGIVDTQSGRMIKTDAELFWLMRELKKPISIAYRRQAPRLKENA